MDEYESFGNPNFDPNDVIASEVIEHADPINDRSVARRLALQVLYEVDSAGHNVHEVIVEQLSHHQVSGKARRYLARLVSGVLEHRERLDEVIQPHAPEWPLNQVAIVDRNILRMAVYEFAVVQRVPVRAAIAEAVELAKLFGAEGAPRFVNGVLGSMADEEAHLKSILKEDQRDEESGL